MVEELGYFNGVYLCITSCISTIPPNYKTLNIPILSMEAAHDTFYHIYKHGKQYNSIIGILK